MPQERQAGRDRKLREKLFVADAHDERMFLAIAGKEGGDAGDVVKSMFDQPEYSC